MLPLTLFLAVGMVVLTNVSSICTSDFTLKLMYAKGDILVFCDYGREIKVKNYQMLHFLSK